jgi:hypothetical protein
MLRFESDLVCAPYHHGKMIVASYFSVNTVMTDTLDSYSIWTLSVLLGFAPWEASGTSLSLLTITLVTLEFSFWRAKIKYLSTFGS